MSEIKRICTMCSSTFTTNRTTGRPRAFCSPACKEESKTNPTRLCIVCENEFLKSDPHAPFYCSERCWSMGSPCQQCGRPTHTKFCSHECITEMFPPPYTCRVCQKPFTASEYFLNKQASLNGPPKYCSSACWEQRNTYQPGQPTPRSGRRTTEYLVAMDQVTSVFGPYYLPLRPNGMPWVNIIPTLPMKELHIRSRNTIAFWDYALNTYTESLTPLQYNAFLMEFVCKRSSPHPKAIEFQEGWRIWPYIEQFLDERYSPSMFERFCGDYFYAKRAFMRKCGAMPLEELNMKVAQCEGAWKTELRSIGDARTKQHTKFCEMWLRPMRQTRAPYDNTVNPTHWAHYSRIQVELNKYYNAVDKMSSHKLHLAYLTPLTDEEFQMLDQLNMQIMADATKVYFHDPDTMADPNTTTPYPWGPNRYAAMVKAHFEDPVEQVKWEMRTSAKYNLPEPTL